MLAAFRACMVSSWLKNNILGTTKTRKGVTLYEVKHQKIVDVVLALCCLSLNLELLPFSSISFTNLSMYFVDRFNFANVETIVLTERNDPFC